MIFDAVPFGSINALRNPPFKRRALNDLVSFFEEKLGITAVVDTRSFPFERPDLSAPLSKALLLKERGILTAFAPAESFPDEPRLKSWGGIIADAASHAAGGASLFSEEQAILAMTAEALERYIWLEQSDYFDLPTRATTAQIRKKGAYIDPQRFTSFSEEQRGRNPTLRLPDDASYLWIKGDSLVTGKKTYLPAQTIAPQRIVSRIVEIQEPLIRLQITNGLATWPTQAGARLRGMLEVLERDAFIIAWFNQLTLPRIDLEPLKERSASLSRFLDTCARYRLKVHAVRLLTDAPTHAVCVVIEDESDRRLLNVGLKAHQSLIVCIEKALTEALRARIAMRHKLEKAEWDATRPVDEVGHYERIEYWSHPQHVESLDFLIAGELQSIQESPWERESETEYLKRIVAWCRSVGYECVAVPLSSSASNPTDWHIEMVVIPELQQLHLFEKLRALGGTRLKSIPAQFGYTPRAEPFIGAPHPFA